MPSFSDMKAKASKLASSGAERAQGLRDRNTSVPLKKTNWDPYSGAPPPPPPPPRANPNNKPTALAPLPPPPSRTGSSVGSGSTGPATLDRTTSTASAAIPPLPNRGSSTGAPPPLPRRTSTLEPPPLPVRRASVSPASSISDVPTPPPPPSRSPQPPLSRLPFQMAQPSPPVPNLSTKPGLAPVSSPPISALPVAASMPKPSPATVSLKSPTPQFHESAAEQVEIDWANLTEQDRQVFFSWLDEFFTRLLGVPVRPRQGSRVIHA